MSMFELQPGPLITFTLSDDDILSVGDLELDLPSLQTSSQEIISITHSAGSLVLGPDGRDGYVLDIIIPPAVFITQDNVTSVIPLDLSRVLLKLWKYDFKESNYGNYIDE